MLRAADLYCGAGGTTTGAIQAGVSVRLAINHWKTAIFTHRENHPDIRHICAPIDAIDPRDFRPEKIDLIMASPECTHHSIARGGRPVCDQRRAGGWDVLKWVEALRPKWLLIENVREWLDWGPLGVDMKPLKSKKGETFQAWVNAIRSLGYRVEWKLLNAADYGAATSRVRLFILARRGSGRIKWPAPSHGQNGDPLAWRSAASVIDWGRECPSIFFRKRPLAEKTLRRIEIGLRRFCGGAHLVKLRGTSTVSSLRSPVPTLSAGGTHCGLAMPFTVQWDNHGGRGSYVRPIGSPLGTFVTKANQGVCIPFLATVNHGDKREAGGRTASIDDPLQTITAHNGRAVVTPFLLKYHGGAEAGQFARFVDPSAPFPVIDTQPRFGMAYPFLVPNFGERSGQPPRTHSVFGPLPAVTGHGAGCLTVPWLMSYYGTNNMHGVDEPVATITTKDRHGLLQAAFEAGRGMAMLRILDRHRMHSPAMRSLLCTMWELGVADIGFRMLDVDELLVAQGFPAEYKLWGTKADQTKLVGNAVCPPVARALCEAIASA